MPRLPSRLLAAVLVPLGLAWTVAAAAAERSVYLGSFDKVRVQGPFDVRIATGQAPAALLSGDRAVIDSIDLRVDGSTLIIRAAIGSWQERPRVAATAPVTITLATPTLSTASVVGAGKLAIDRMKAARIDLSVTGAGSVGVGEASADAANATIIGTGAITVGGRAGTARLMTNGSGTIDAAALEVGELVVRLDGPGATRAQARYTASVVNTGLGQVTIGGQPKCTVKADAGGPVSCGTGR
ncbi:GIN domain-containing protein [Sphingomonas bacterium]|uniref:GIN domain-containing protein n=1 Tax=Sphingomonas bacterium TaxID=1895847 RepID=UPI0015771ED8|nr:DUF2807 domain-containing protein [Sphingomonas bacterium]